MWTLALAPCSPGFSFAVSRSIAGSSDSAAEKVQKLSDIPCGNAPPRTKSRANSAERLRKNSSRSFFSASVSDSDSKFTPRSQSDASVEPSSGMEAGPLRGHGRRKAQRMPRFSLGPRTRCRQGRNHRHRCRTSKSLLWLTFKMSHDPRWRGSCGSERGS